MKKKNVTKRDLGKFSKVNTHKRRGKERTRAELYRALASIDVKSEGVRIKDSDATGRQHRPLGHTGLGVFSGTRSGFGFVAVDALERDVFIPEEYTSGAIDGDYVECVYRIYRSYTGEERTEGRVTRIVTEGRETVTGVVYSEPSHMRGRHRVEESYYLLPDDSRLSIRPRLKDISGAHVGDKVAVRILRGSGTGISPYAELAEVFGSVDSTRANYEAILYESGIPVDFSDVELREAEQSAISVTAGDTRVRYNDRVIFTIDGEGAKDLDDAISLRRVRGGWSLGVHIADVSCYVPERSALDRAAICRGTSVYFTDKVVPMLPPVLSNGACSLNAGEDKLVLSAIISLGADGAIRSVRLEEGVIRSRVRGVYSEVNAIFEGRATEEIKKKYKDVLRSLEAMHELYLVLEERARARGALELEMPESTVALDDQGVPVAIVKRERGDAERMIEQFMLTANEAVATLLCEREIPCVYRVHADPPEDKLRSFLITARNLGVSAGYVPVESPDPRKLSEILGRAEEAGLIAPVSYAMLRSMAKAEYSDKPARHFGLGIERYCHFTSPIRRLSDLATHRIIHRVLLEGGSARSFASYAARAARAATDAEVRAVNAERRIEELYKVVYMSGRVGECFDAFVSSVTSFGMFAELDIGCEGLVPISDMPGYFIYDEKNMTLRSGNVAFRLGDRIRVRVVEADISSSKIRLTPEL